MRANGKQDIPAGRDGINAVIPAESTDCTRYSFADDTGDAVMMVYQVFPGIQVVYNSVHMDRLTAQIGAAGKVIEIQHCQEGRIEQEFEDGFFYLMPGDLSVSFSEQSAKTYTFPLRHYHGISIVIHTDAAPRCFSCILEDVAVEPLAVAEKLCRDRSCYVIRSQGYVEHIFSELYAVPESIRKAYLKIKILELFLMLSRIEPDSEAGGSAVLSSLQVRLAKEAAAYLAAHMERRVTIAELAETFHVSQTHLKSAFKGVFGVPIYSHVRILKMQAAALQLIHTDRSILEIANECGYDNGSKFAGAFRGVMGETPSEYRKAHKKRAAK